LGRALKFGVTGNPGFIESGSILESRSYRKVPGTTSYAGYGNGADGGTKEVR